MYRENSDDLKKKGVSGVTFFFFFFEDRAHNSI